MLSGGTSRDDLSRYTYRPDRVVESIADLDPDQLLREFSPDRVMKAPRREVLQTY